MSRSAVALKLPFSCRNARRVSRSLACWSSSSASCPGVSCTQVRSSSTELAIRASGATSAKLVSRGPDGPAASATACAANACWWVRRKPETPAPTAPKANRIPGSAPAPRQRFAARLPLAGPAHQANVVLPQAVAQDGFGGVDVDQVAFKHGPDPGGSGGAEVAQPVLPLGLVGDHQLFRYAVDVGGGDPGDPQPSGADARGVVGVPPEFLQAPVLEPGRADLDDLQQRAAEAKTSAQAAVSESRDQLRRRIDQAKAEVDDKATDARQQVDAVAANARSRWAQLKADTAAKLDDFDAKMDRRADQLDAKVAASQADGAEADAADAIDFAAWTVDNARLAVLDAIDFQFFLTLFGRTRR